MLYDSQTANLLLGALMNDPTLFLNNKYKLNKDDFKPNRFHRILYVAAENVAKQGVEEITEVEIGAFMSAYPKQLEVLRNNNFIDFIQSIKKLSNSENVEYYWSTVRKYSILRKLKEKNYPIDKIYNESDSSKFNMMTLDEIIQYFEGGIAEIAKEYRTSKRLVEYRAGSNFENNKETFKKSPLIGESFQSPYLNSICRGMYGFVLRSGNSGSGKTTMSVGDLCKMCATDYYDYKNGWVKNKSRCGAGLFINSEMDLEKELEPMFISWISGVKRDHIIDGRYEKGEEERVSIAGKILYNSEIFLVDDPDFTIQSLTSTIQDYALNKHIKVCCFDYVASNTYVQSEVSSRTKVPQREDMILLAETDALKQISRKTGVSVLSGTQLNTMDNNITTVTPSLLMGGAGQVRKVDACLIIVPPTKKELELTKGYARHKGFTDSLEPNFVSHVVKGRANKYGKNIKVFQYVDLSTARTTDLFVTDKDNNLIKVEKLIIESN